MGRLIDADVLYESLKKRSKALAGIIGDIGGAVSGAAKLVLAQSPVDAVPVVRCAECDFWDKDHISCEGLAKCLTGESGIRYRNRSDFCSKGRKRGGDSGEI